MIIIFNRKELYRGYSMPISNEIMNNLKKANIKFSFKLKFLKNSSMYSDNMGSRSAHSGSMDLSTKYYIYVHKKDYEQAAWINNKLLY